MKKHIPFLAIVVSALILGGCVSTREATGQLAPASGTASLLAGKTWLLSGILADGIFMPLEPGHATDAKIVFTADGTFSGTSGTNTFSGTWTAKNPDRAGLAPCNLTIKKITRMAAPNAEAARFEQILTAYIDSAVAIKAGKNTLAFLDGKGATLVSFLFRVAN
jgi:heat shock protein HslJ